MKKFLLAIVSVCIYTSITHASISVDEEILDATNSLKRFFETKRIPSNVVEQARAIVIVPNYMKASFLIGGQHGEGIVVFKLGDKRWSNPFFINITGGSLGIQFGFESSETIFIFRTDKSVKGLLNKKITIGTEISASVGPMEENYNIYKEANFKSDILTYHIKEGLFAGASFDGAVIRHNSEKNLQMYNVKLTSPNIIASPKKNSVYGIRELDKTLNRYISKGK